MVPLTKTLLVLNDAKKLTYMGFTLTMPGPATPELRSRALEETGLAEECGRFVLQLLSTRVSSMLCWLNGLPELTLLLAHGAEGERGPSLGSAVPNTKPGKLSSVFLVSMDAMVLAFWPLTDESTYRDREREKK